MAGFDLSGLRVATLHEGVVHAGEMVFDRQGCGGAGRPCASGIDHFSATGAGVQVTMRGLLLK